MKIPFLRSKEAPREYVRPEPTVLPSSEHFCISALYRGARTGGDFFDVLAVPGTDRLVLLLLDIAGDRADTLGMAAHVQQVFRRFVLEKLISVDVNVAERLSDLVHTLNLAILERAGEAHFCPAFVASYNQQLGILCYVNAGHTPALVKDSGGVTLLSASGLPLGLFSHATHDAQMVVLEPNAALVLVSRGIVECKQRSREYGIESVVGVLEKASFDEPQQICAALLADAQRYAGEKGAQNDWTTLALMRAKIAGLAMGA